MLFDDWNERAGVRSGPRRMFHEDREQGRLLFPASETPYLAHLNDHLGPAAVDFIAAQRLFEYLNFTFHLESRVVNRAMEALAHVDLGLDLSPEFKLDAFRIYTDEAYHSLYTLDLIQQLTKDSRDAPLPYRFTLLETLTAEAAEVETLAPGLAQLLQATVFETVVTSILDAIPQDDTVVSVVSQMIGDHARDERRHHAYFARLFPLIWSRCDTRTRSAAGVYLAHCICACLTPDLLHAKTVLTAAHVPDDAAKSALAATYAPDAVTAKITTTARHTLKLLAAHDVFDDARTREAFHRRGLLPAGV